MESHPAGNSGRNELGGGGWPLTTSRRISGRDEPRNGRTPVAASYSTQPKENKSERGPSSSPRVCSGDIYAGVPKTVCAAVASIPDASAPVNFAKPKSSTLTPAG